MQAGSTNVQISEDTGLDWAICTVAVAVATPIASAVKPSVTIDSGGVVTIDSFVAPINDLTITGIESVRLVLKSAGRLEIEQSFGLANASELAIEIAGAAAGQYGEISVGGEASVDGVLTSVPASHGRKPIGKLRQCPSAHPRCRTDVGH